MNTGLVFLFQFSLFAFCNSNIGINFDFPISLSQLSGPLEWMTTICDSFGEKIKKANKIYVICIYFCIENYVDGHFVVVDIWNGFLCDLKGHKMFGQLFGEHNFLFAD